MQLKYELGEGSTVAALAVRGKSRARSRARELRPLAVFLVVVNDQALTSSSCLASERKPLAPFGLRAAQVHLLRCPSLPMLGHGLRRFALHLHPRRPQRGSWDFHHGLLEPLSPLAPRLFTAA